ncbi:protein-methionine-sulfoxide reductase catalytic subunit MsrP, partial [bacterium]|nr:protein-methionine-sulfoxide reductase catalytic subunit MsrP [bacterium]
QDEITPKALYFSRRKFLKLSAVVGVTAALAACGVAPTASETPAPDVETPLDTITHYNNYYEFSTDKAAVANLVSYFETEPWTVEIGGLVDHPMTLSADDIIRKYPASEHVYRHRCVEGWSIVVPWDGFPLHQLLADLGVQPEAKYLAFTTVYRPAQMPGQSDSFYPWPYTEGLRLDEANNDLVLVASGLYGEPLPKQDGAPLRIVVPWKYGFKSIKSIVKLEAVANQPTTFWNTTAPDYYGFYSNVNPDVTHVPWSQATERRLGETGRRPTLLFNGYGDQVASLYEGMDLNANY